jgi:LacI family transcriptional regulator, galactose operon repressor
MPTIRDVAKMAGVSVSTVSLAFSSPHRLRRETLEKVREAARATGYVADPVARSLAGGRSRLIGMVVADILNPFFGTMLSEVERRAGESGYLVIIADSNADTGRERQILELLSSQRVAGIVLSPCSSGEDYGRYFDTLPMPVVMFDQKIEGVARDFVGTDNRLASAMLARHLLQHGHRRIGLITGKPALFTSRERTAGFVETMRDAGVEADESLIGVGNYDNEDAYVAAMRLLTRSDRPTAIVVAANLMALAALQAIQDLGFRCPQDISLACIDEVPWGKVISPRLTCSVQDPTRLGTLAADRLLARIADPEVRDSPPLDLIVPPQFRVGGSCARPA